MKSKYAKLVALLLLVAASLVFARTADAACSFTQSGITYLVFETGEGQCTVHTFDAENGSYVNSSAGACAPGSGSC